MFEWLPVNWRLIGNPINWLIVVFMVIIASIALEVVLQAAQGNGLTFAVNLPGLPSQAGSNPNA